MKTIFTAVAVAAIVTFTSMTAQADSTGCSMLPNHDALKAALTDARKEANGGLNLDMWATVVDRSGYVCAVAFTAQRWDGQWPGSRVISAQKANTANAFSLAGLALSTANLYSAVQPGGSLFGLQDSNPVDTHAAYDGAADDFGTDSDPMEGKRVGGVNVFGGGLALYNKDGQIVGGLGVSGDTSCADHNIAWRARHALNFDFVPKGVSKDNNDAIIYDVKNGHSAGGFGHVTCGGKEDVVAKGLVKTQTVAAKEDKAAPAKE